MLQGLEGGRWKEKNVGERELLAITITVKEGGREESVVLRNGNGNVPGSRSTDRSRAK